MLRLLGGVELELILRYLKSASLWPLGPWVDGVYWSLGIELSFYGIVGLAMQWNRSNGVGIVVLSIGILSSFYLALGGSLIGGESAALWDRLAQLALLPHGVFFAVGFIIWKILGGQATILECICLPVFGIVGLYGLPDTGLKPALCLSGAVLFLIIAGYADSWIRKHCSRIVMKIETLSQSTYALYLLHNACGNILLKWCFDLGINKYLSLFSVQCVLLALSVVITKWPERYLRRVLESYLRLGERPQRIGR